MGVHLPVVGGHAGQHGPDEGVAEPECRGRELVEHAGVAGRVVVVRVALSLNDKK